MAYDCDADAGGDFPEQKVVGEAPQINPPPVLCLKMKTLWVSGGPLDKCV